MIDLYNIYNRLPKWYRLACSEHAALWRIKKMWAYVEFFFLIVSIFTIFLQIYYWCTMNNHTRKGVF